jgi:hypothetical protein
MRFPEAAQGLLVHSLTSASRNDYKPAPEVRRFIYKLLIYIIILEQYKLCPFCYRANDDAAWQNITPCLPQSYPQFLWININLLVTHKLS